MRDSVTMTLSQPSTSPIQVIGEIVTDEPRLPWDRRAGEAAKWYNIFFEYFRPQGPQRTMVIAYRRWRSDNNVVQRSLPAEAAQSAPKTWVREANRWQWRERAEAWDEMVRAEQYQAEEAERQRIRQMVIDANIDLLEAGQRVAQAIGPDDASLGQSAAATRAASHTLGAMTTDKKPDISVHLYAVCKELPQNVREKVMALLPSGEEK